MEREPGAAPDVGHQRAVLELRLHPVEGRDHDRHEQRPRHGPEHALYVVRGLGAEVVVRHSDARRERFGQAVDEAERPRFSARGGGEARRVGAREDERADVGELEPVTFVVVEQPGRGVGAEPLEQPPLVQPRAAGELDGGDRSRAVEVRVDAEPVAEVDHQRHHLALLVVPHRERERLHRVGIDRVDGGVSWIRHNFEVSDASGRRHFRRGRNRG